MDPRVDEVLAVMRENLQRRLTVYEMAVLVSVSPWERAKPISVELATPSKQERGRGRNGRRDSTERNRTATAS